MQNETAATNTNTHTHSLRSNSHPEGQNKLVTKLDTVKSRGWLSPQASGPTHVSETLVTCVFGGGVGQVESTSGVVGPAHELDGDLVASGLDQLLDLQVQSTVLHWKQTDTGQTNNVWTIIYTGEKCKNNTWSIQSAVYYGIG